MSIHNLIEVPSAPANISGEPDNQRGAEVHLHLANGSRISATLVSLQHESQLISYAQSGATKPSLLPFDKVNYVEFRRALEWTTPVLPAGEAQPAGDSFDPLPFQIVFNTDELLKGEMCTSLEGDASITVFAYDAKQIVRRLFVPRNNVREYSLGPMLGQILKSRQIVDDGTVEKGLSQQEKLRNKQIGSYLMESGIVTEKELHSALSQQQGEFKLRIGEILVSEGLITQEQLETAIDLQKKDRSRKLGDILIEMGAASEDAICQVLAAKLGIPFLRLKTFAIDQEAVKEIPVHIARQQEVMAIAFNKARLVVAVANPSAVDVVNVLSFVTNRKIDLVVSPKFEIQEAIERHYGSGIEKEISSAEQSASLGVTATEQADDALARMANEKPIVRIVNQIFIDACRRNASDVHFRPWKKVVELLYRIDGSMVHVRNFGKSLLPAITSRIKVTARMDIAQRRLPQDGRIQLSVDGATRDMRVSVIPTVNGESTVVRILAASSELKPVEQIGFSPEDTERFKELLHRGGGLILVTGPTGSGKTSTLYAALDELRQHSLNIITVEDPVEIRLEGTEQVQVEKGIDFTFARALRNVLRHDPDVVMIGEIRDEETARIAVEAAQTGHLVLSTLHTNTAAGAVSRLMQMNIESYLLASTILGVIAQRLIRKNCPACSVPEDVSASTRAVLGIDDAEEFMCGTGCPACSETGYKGRHPVYELLVNNERIREEIVQNGGEVKIKRAAEESGMESIVGNALRHARTGEISIEEVHRIYSS